MKNSNLKKFMAVSLTAALTFVTVPSNFVYATGDDTVVKDYVVLTADDCASQVKAAVNGAEQTAGTDNLITADMTERQANMLEKRADVIAVEEDITLTGSLTEKEEFIKNRAKTEDLNQWYLDAVGVHSDIVHGKDKVKVAVIDSGVSFDEDIDVKYQVDLMPDPTENFTLLDLSGHGSSIAGIIAAKDNGEGITGINPNAELYSVKVLDTDNTSPLSLIVDGIYWCIENNMDIINLSLGTMTDSAILRAAIHDAYNAGILMIAASGNSQNLDVQYPAAYPEVIAVGSVDENGNIANHTSTGTALELLAPGEKILSTGWLGGFMAVEGTSIATAQVTGVASLLLEQDKDKSPEFIRALLKASAKPAQDGLGVIDYGYAAEIYDDFAENYTSGEPIEYDNPVDFAEYDTEGIVTGLWSVATGIVGHEDIANYANAGQIDAIAASYMTYVIGGTLMADEVYGAASSDTSKRVLALHGRYNYVLTLRYLMLMAKKLGAKGDSNVTASDVTTADTQIKSEINYTSLKSKFTVSNDATQFERLIIACKDAVTHKRDGVTSLTHTGKQARAKIWGLAIHELSDIYAHRVVVPKYTIGATPDVGYDSGSRFSSGNFADYATVKTKVNGTALQFLDVKDYMLSSISNANRTYEDNSTFCKERFADAKENCYFYFADGFDGEMNAAELIYPYDTYSGKYKNRLNYFKGYTTEAGLTVPGAWNAEVYTAKRV